MPAYKVTLPGPELAVTADDPAAAWAKLARFFGKLADGQTGDGPDVAGLSLSGLDVTIVEG